MMIKLTCLGWFHFSSNSLLHFSRNSLTAWKVKQKLENIKWFYIIQRDSSLDIDEHFAYIWFIHLHLIHSSTFWATSDSYCCGWNEVLKYNSTNHSLKFSCWSSSGKNSLSFAPFIHSSSSSVSTVQAVPARKSPELMGVGGWPGSGSDNTSTTTCHRLTLTKPIFSFELLLSWPTCNY